MNNLTKKFSVLIASVAMATGVGLVGNAKSNVAKADDVIYRSSVFSISNNTSSTNRYNSTATNTTDDFSVTIANGSNNNNSANWEGHFRFGQNNAASKGSVTTNNPIDKTIIKVSVTIGSKCTSVNGIYVYANTTNTFDEENKVGTFTDYAVNTTITADLTGTSENMYYKVEFDMAAGANGNLDIGQIDFIISGSNVTADAFLAAAAKIPSIDSLTIADKDVIEAARKEYGYLTDVLKDQDDVKAALAILEAAEAKIAELEKAEQEKADETAAADVDALINAIGEVTDYSKAEQIKAARKAYEDLSDNAKTKVTALETLVAAETALAEYAPLVSEFVAGDLGLDNASNLTTYTVNRITYTFDKATGRQPKYYASDKASHCYTGNRLIIQGNAKVGTITSISITLSEKPDDGITVMPATSTISNETKQYNITITDATNTVVTLL